MANNKGGKPPLIVNRRARYDYQLKQIFQAGMMLSGPEVRSLRSGHGHLRGAYVNLKDGELWLYNATITPTHTNRNALSEADQTRARKLLVKKRELDQLRSAKEQGLTIIPTKIMTAKRYIKLEIATARGLKKYDKREKMKERDSRRDIRRELSPKNKPS